MVPSKLLAQNASAIQAWCVLPVLLRIDRRRPASWLTLVAAAGIVWVLSTPPCSAMRSLWSVLLASLAGASLAVAASGDVPHHKHGLSQSPWIRLLWLCERVAWPVAGVLGGLLAMFVAWFLAGVPTGVLGRSIFTGTGVLCIATGMTTGMIGSVAVMHLSRVHDVQAADAASLSLWIACAASAVGWLVDQTAGEAGDADALAGIAVAAAAWTVIALAIWRAIRGLSQPEALRRWLTILAMAMALVGMVGWLFLAPDHASLYVVMAVGWFVCLAIPQATLGDGVVHRRAWQPLYRSAAERPAAYSGGWTDRKLRTFLQSIRRAFLNVGCDRAATTTALVYGAILGWPPLVAAVVLAGTADGGVAAIATVSVLVAATVSLAILSKAIALAGGSGETSLSVSLCLALAMLLLWAMACGDPNGAWSSCVSLPSLPGLPERVSEGSSK